MKSKYVNIILFLMIPILLAGCMYPQNERAQNKIPYQDQLDMVQKAVDTYSEQTNGLMPIKTSESDIGVFQKHLIDFFLLKEKSIISVIPGNAFEQGGIYQYTIITPDEDPRVKLIDIRTADTLQKVHVKLDLYRSKKIYPPFGKEVGKGIFYIDYEKIGFKTEPYVVSPYSDENLPILMDIYGKLYIDYRIDLQNAIQAYDHDYKEGEDIRYLLAENTPFVPAYSLPYTILNEEPVFLIE